MNPNKTPVIASQLTVAFLGMIWSATAMTVMPTPPLSARVSQAETIFLGKVANLVREGDWVRADLIVEEPLRNAELGQKTAVIWRAKIGGNPIYDVAEGVRGIAILKDKHEGRYWLRGDKFEDPEKLIEVKKALITNGIGVEVNGMQLALTHPALFYADEGLGLTLKLKNLSDRDQSFSIVEGISGATLGKMTWKIKDLKTGTIWQAVANPNPGPEPGAPVSMSLKTLNPGEAFDATVHVLRWGQMFATEVEPKRTALTLPVGKYVAELSLEVASTVVNNIKTTWTGNLTNKSGEFEVSAALRPIAKVVPVRLKREQIVALARERMVSYWEQQKVSGNAECKALNLTDLQVASVKVVESFGRGIDQDQTVFNITFLAPCPQLGGKVRFEWSYNQFGDERAMNSAQLIKEAAAQPPGL